jgi:formate dehydrogenase major subunit
MGASTCVACGECVQACPTGALMPASIVDAAGKGHPEVDRTVDSVCPYCGVGCQIDIHVDRGTRKIVKITSDPSYVPNEGNLCVKGRFAFNFVHHPDRLTRPLVRGEDGELHPASWDDALRVAAEGLKGVKERHGPQSVGILASARLTMEENFLLQKLARTALETHSIHSCEAT